MKKAKAHAGKMMIGERRRRVVETVQVNGRAVVAELAAELGISEITIRKDLEKLQSQGLIQRTHGGAIAVQRGVLNDPSYKEKEKRQLREKQRIAAAAAKMVREGDCVILDSGTTTTAVARALREFSKLTVITNAINIAAELADTDFEVIVTGGVLRRNSVSLVGPLAEEDLRELRADVLFIGADGLDSRDGITTPSVPESRVGRAMAASARTVVVVCDSTKFGRRSLALVFPIRRCHKVITDKAAPPEDVAALREAGVEVELV